jgi:hypothetical protein
MFLGLQKSIFCSNNDITARLTEVIPAPNQIRRHERVQGIGRTAVRIWQCVVSVTHQPLHRREQRSRYPLDMRRSGHSGKQKNLYPCRESNSGQARSEMGEEQSSLNCNKGQVCFGVISCSQTKVQRWRRLTVWPCRYRPAFKGAYCLSRHPDDGGSKLVWNVGSMTVRLHGGTCL